ncbi:hypothetical protein C0J52_08688 [Blattella germanica]|nr:hypothetical protein C0J52_08688 [Blattella germanica]
MEPIPPIQEPTPFMLLMGELYPMPVELMQLPFMLMEPIAEPSMLEPNVAAVCGEHEFMVTQLIEFMLYVGAMGLTELLAPPPPAPLLIATESEYGNFCDNMVTACGENHTHTRTNGPHRILETLAHCSATGRNSRRRDVWVGYLLHTIYSQLKSNTD